MHRVFIPVMASAKYLFSNILFGLVLLTSYHAEAQTNYMQGYYVTAQNDTVRGFIEYISGSRRYEKIEFKYSIPGRSQQLFPSETLAYGILGIAEFESHQVKNKKGDNIVAFFRVLARGTMSLLEYESRYFVKTGNQLQQVSKEIVVIDGRARSDYRGLGLLKSLMNDCPDVANFDITKPYNWNEFQDLVVRYNSCKGSNTKVFSERPVHSGTKLLFGPQVTPNISMVKLSGQFGPASLNSNVGVKPGLFAGLYVPGWGDKTRLYLESSYGTFDGYSLYTVDQTNNDVIVKYSFVEVPLYLRLGGNKFFVDLGLYSQFLFNKQTRWRVETIDTNLGVVNTTEGEIESLHGSFLGVLGGVGYAQNILQRPLRCSLRCTYAGNYELAYSPKYTAIGLVVSYQLNRVH